MKRKFKSYNRKIRQVGSSFAVTLEKGQAKGKGFKLGDRVDVTLEEVVEEEENA